jgi:exodeoxyribonuclease-5
VREANRPNRSPVHVRLCAVTCHKAQGSRWNSVYVINEGYCWKRTWEHFNWLYTAITRAAERVTIVT